MELPCFLEGRRESKLGLSEPDGRNRGSELEAADGPSAGRESSSAGEGEDEDSAESGSRRGWKRGGGSQLGRVEELQQRGWESHVAGTMTTTQEAGRRETRADVPIVGGWTTQVNASSQATEQQQSGARG